MNPIVIPASTATTALAGALTTIVVWALRAFAHVDAPVEVATAITTLAAAVACHFTKDTTP